MIETVERSEREHFYTDKSIEKKPQKPINFQLTPLKKHFSLPHIGRLLGQGVFIHLKINEDSLLSNKKIDQQNHITINNTQYYLNITQQKHIFIVE